MMNIAPPPAFQGDERTQLTQVYRYLFRLSEELNAASAALDNQASRASESIAQAAGIELTEKTDTDNQYTALVSLVVKTAEIVRGEMDVLTTRLKQSYIAKSEWGTYQEDVERKIKETAKYTLENYQYGAEVFNIPEMAAAFDAYRIEAAGYIKRGIIGYDDEGYPILGIAIAQELKSKTVTVGGVEYEEFDKTVNMATYTAEKLSFWIDGVETAYLSNGELYVTRIIVLDSIKLGGWDIDVNGKDELEIQKEFGRAIVTAETVDVIASDINLSANKSITRINGEMEVFAAQLEIVASTANDVQKWFKFTNDRGLIIQKPEYTDDEGTVHPASIWYTVTDETGYHIYNTQQTAAVGSFQRGGLKTTGVEIGEIAAKRTATGGWVWTDTE